MLKNHFFEQVKALYDAGNATPERLRELLGSGRTKRGMFEGDMQEGELEIGQVAALINKVQPVSEVFKELLTEYTSALEGLPQG